MTQALLLIDIQNDYFPGGAMECKGMEKAAENSSVLLERFRRDGKPIFFIRHLSVRPVPVFSFMALMAPKSMKA